MKRRMILLLFAILVVSAACTPPDAAAPSTEAPAGPTAAEPVADRPAEDAGASPGLGGKLVNTDGGPVVGATACWVVGEEIGECGTSDDTGRFMLPLPLHPRIRIMAEGYHPALVTATSLDAAVVMYRAPVLWVRLIDADTGEAISEGELRVAYSSGRQFGPFPVNAAGVKIQRLLPPGEVLLRVLAPGYRFTDPESVELKSGFETKVDIKLTRE